MMTVQISSSVDCTRSIVLAQHRSLADFLSPDSRCWGIIASVFVGRIAEPGKATVIGWVAAAPVSMSIVLVMINLEGTNLNSRGA
jgi:hypothetical protein